MQIKLPSILSLHCRGFDGTIIGDEREDATKAEARTTSHDATAARATA